MCFRARVVDGVCVCTCVCDLGRDCLSVTVRESRARVARPKILVYIYIYIFVVPFSRSRARNQYSPLGVAGAKSDFLWCPVSGAFSGCFRRLQRTVLGSLLEGSGTLFSWLRARVCEECEKVLSWSVIWREEPTSCIAKTCKPYSTSFKNRRCASTAFCSPTCVPRMSILGSQKRVLEPRIGGQLPCSLALGSDASF